MGRQRRMCAPCTHENGAAGKKRARFKEGAASDERAAGGDDGGEMLPI
jgi:hypothetical protein